MIEQYYLIGLNSLIWPQVGKCSALSLETFLNIRGLTELFQTKHVNYHKMMAHITQSL